MPTCLPEIVPLSAGPPSETNHLRMRCTRLTLWCRGRLRGQFRLGGSFETVATFCSQSLGIAMRSKHGVASDRLLWHRRHRVRAAVATSDNHDGGNPWIQEWWGTCSRSSEQPPTGATLGADDLQIRRRSLRCSPRTPTRMAAYRHRLRRDGTLPLPEALLAVIPPGSN